MTLSGICVASVVLVGLSVVGTGRALAAQSAPTVDSQIIQPDQEDTFLTGTVLLKAPGLVAPRLTKQFDPKYTVGALRAKIEGDVKIQAIVGVNGRVEKARMKESLDPDLDAEALRTLDKWEFEPGTMNGVPVRVVVEVVMAFRIHR